MRGRKSILRYGVSSLFPCFSVRGGFAAFRTAALVGMCFWVALFLASPVNAGIEGDRDLLILVANGYKANMDRLVTWKGRATIEQTFVHGEERKRWHSDWASFAVDKASGAKRWNRHQLVNRGVANGVEDADPPCLQSCMFKDGAYYVYSYEENPELSPGFRGHVNIRAEEAAKVNPYGRDFDPFFYFGDGGRDFHQLLTMLASDDAAGLVTGRATRREDVIAFEQWGTGPDGGPRQTLWEFDLAQGCNLIHYVHRAPERGYLDEHRFSYNSTNGVFVPQKVTFHKERREHAGRHDVTDWTVEFTENQVNERLAPSEFTFEAMEVLPGALVMDDRLGLRYTYGVREAQMEEPVLTPLEGESLVPPSDVPVSVEHTRTASAPVDTRTAPAPVVQKPVPMPPATPATVAPEQRPLRARLLVLVAGLAFVGLVVMWLRRRIGMRHA